MNMTLLLPGIPTVFGLRILTPFLVPSKSKRRLTKMTDWLIKEWLIMAKRVVEPRKLRLQLPINKLKRRIRKEYLLLKSKRLLPNLLVKLNLLKATKKKIRMLKKNPKKLYQIKLSVFAKEWL
jgi:hypothetical protein